MKEPKVCPGCGDGMEPEDFGSAVSELLVPALLADRERGNPLRRLWSGLQLYVTKGVSVDFFGYIWVVSMDTRAYRVDPETQTYDIYDGLNQAYTYSDMTGWGLKNVQVPQ